MTTTHQAVDWTDYRLTAWCGATVVARGVNSGKNKNQPLLISCMRFFQYVCICIFVFFLNRGSVLTFCSYNLPMCTFVNDVQLVFLVCLCEREGTCLWALAAPLIILRSSQVFMTIPYPHFKVRVGCWSWPLSPDLSAFCCCAVFWTASSILVSSSRRLSHAQAVYYCCLLFCCLLFGG